MKTKLIALLCFLSVTCLAQPIIRNRFTTNTPTDALSVAPFSAMADFSQTNGVTRGLSITAKDGSHWVFQGANGSTSATNNSIVVSNMWTVDFRTNAAAVYASSTSAPPVDHVFIEHAYVTVNAAGDQLPAITILISTNSPGAAGSGYGLSSGFHISEAAAGLDFGQITGGGVDATVLGTIPWNYANPAGKRDGKFRRWDIYLHPEYNAFRVVGDDLNGWVTNALFANHFTKGTNKTYVTFEQAGNVGSTNAIGLRQVSRMGFGNRAAANLSARRDAFGTYAKLTEPNAFQAPLTVEGGVTAAGALISSGTSSALSLPARNSGATFQLYNDANYFRLFSSSDLFTFASSGWQTNLAGLRLNGGGLIFGTDNTYDIGANGATRPRRIYVASEVYSPNFIADPTGYIFWNGRSAMYSDANGSIRMVNSASTDFNRLQFGGTTAAFPALGRTNGHLAVLGGNGLFSGSNTNGLWIHGGPIIQDASPTFTSPGAPVRQGALYWNDGTNIIATIRDSAGTITTNKLSMTAWP